MPKAESEKHPAVKVGRRPGFPVCSVAHTRICDQRQYPDLLPQEREICILLNIPVFLNSALMAAGDNHAL